MTVPGRRTETITVVTTLTDPEAYSREDIAELYGYRWNVELDIRQIKQTLRLDHVRCKTPEMVRRELWVTLLAYNLIRKVIATAAAVHQKQPRQLGFTLACQSVLSSWMLLVDGILPRSRGAVPYDPGPHRRQRGGQPPRPHRTARPQTPPPPLPAHATAPRATTSRTAKNLNP